MLRDRPLIFTRRDNGTFFSAGTIIVLVANAVSLEIRDPDVRQRRDKLIVDSQLAVEFVPLLWVGDLVQAEICEHHALLRQKYSTATPA